MGIKVGRHGIKRKVIIKHVISSYICYYQIYDIKEGVINLSYHINC
jgi:hypothetical protein